MASSLQEDEMDEERARRSILVSNIRGSNLIDKVIIHFQKERNGGGEVDSAVYPDHRDHSAVVVTFEDPSTVETAINRRPHTVEGHEVTVQRYPVPVMIPEVFDHVRARLNCNIFDSTDMLGNVVEQLQRECGVDYKKSSSGIYITGSFVQIKDCHKYILDLIQSKHHQDVSRSNFAEEASKYASITTEEPHFQIKNTVKEIKDVVYQTVPIVFKFILSVSKYRRQLEQIKKDHKVNIREIDSGNKVTIQPLHRCTQKDFDEACEEYINLYREVHDGPMLSKEMVLKPGLAGSVYFTAQEAIDLVLSHAPVIIQSTATQDKWLFYGEEKQVKLAMEEICKKLKIEYPFKRGRKHIDDSGRHDMEGSTSQRNLGSDKENLQPGTSSDVDKKFPASASDERREEYLTKKGFKLSVSQGDITDEHVDIIVNCNDDYLIGFSKGLPKAIVDKGGREIQLEAEAQSKKRRLKAGDIIITKAGNLYCSKVMHIIALNNKKNKVVLKNMVKDACLNCLRRAKSQNSIAFPAVGANKVGLSLQDCATAMLNGVEEYMKTCNPKTDNVLVDIRFVHLIPVAFEVFRQELRKRFGAPTTERGADPRERNRTHDQHSATRPTENRNGTPTDNSKAKEQDVCPICLEDFSNPIKLEKCKHQFCKECIESAFKHHKKCPTCGMVYGVQTGNMPRGTMNCRLLHYMRLPGHDKYGTTEISYNFPSGIQGPEHPNPGQRYSGTSRTAYLPDSPEGQQVTSLLKKAFDARLTFTIGTSVTTGQPNTVTWNDIHHKTSTHGGATEFGYPDPGYLKRVKEELAAKGIC